jgi:hypothetical protein
MRQPTIHQMREKKIIEEKSRKSKGYNMMALEQRMDPTEFKIFIEQNFTIRQSDKFWPGLWSDLIADVVYETLRWIGTCAWNLQQ